MKKKHEPMVKCGDCGRKYQRGALHNAFCSAKTCRMCMSTYGHVLPIYDSRPEALEDGEPERRCDNCINEELDERIE